MTYTKSLKRSPRYKKVTCTNNPKCFEGDIYEEPEPLYVEGALSLREESEVVPLELPSGYGDAVPVNFPCLRHSGA